MERKLKIVLPAMYRTLAIPIPLCWMTVLVSVAACLAATAPASAAPDVHGDLAQTYTEQIRPFLKRHCVQCHSGEKPKGDLRLDELASDFGDEAVRDRWLAVRERLTKGEMPPESEGRPPRREVDALSQWIGSRSDAAQAAERSTEGRVVLRRLNRVEYENTIRDLLGIHVELKEMLPRDSSSDGFDNVGDALHLSSFQMEKYLEAADKVLERAIANRPEPPPAVKKRYFMKDQHQVKTTTEDVYRKLGDDSAVLFSSSHWTAIVLYEFYPSQRGDYRFRVSASGFQSSGKPVSYRLDAGNLSMTGKPSLVGYFDAPANEPSVVEFVAHLEPTNTLRIHPYGLASSQGVHAVGADKYDGPGLRVDWVDVEGPLNDNWPPESHRRIFGDLPQGPAPQQDYSPRVQVVSNDPRADGERVLRRFARRAFRRAVTDDDLEPIMSLVEATLAEGRPFEEAVRVGLAAIMVSPEFLFLDETPGKLNDFALASRLSYFLWSSMPDDELLDVAERSIDASIEASSGDKSRGAAGTLGEPEVLRAQVERMLDDPRAGAFTENFVGQWLGLRDIDFTLPSHILYPEFDDMLKVSMVRETELFFAEILKHDLSLLNFISSDFAMLNGRLAKHYGIEGVEVGSSARRRFLRAAIAAES
jgi:hypothetical protein